MTLDTGTASIITSLVLQNLNFYFNAYQCGEKYIVTSLYARRYMSSGMIHVQRSFCELACALNKFRLVESLNFGYKVQWQQIHPTVERFLTNQTLGDILYPGFWLVENCSTVWCICWHWTLYPKINFQPIRTCFNACANSGNDCWTCNIP